MLVPETSLLRPSGGSLPGDPDKPPAAVVESGPAHAKTRNSHRISPAPSQNEKDPAGDPGGEGAGTLPSRGDPQVEVDSMRLLHLSRLQGHYCPAIDTEAFAAECYQECPEAVRVPALRRPAVRHENADLAATVGGTAHIEPWWAQLHVRAENLSALATAWRWASHAFVGLLVVLPHYFLYWPVKATILLLFYGLMPIHLVVEAAVTPAQLRNQRAVEELLADQTHESDGMRQHHEWLGKVAFRESLVRDGTLAAKWRAYKRAVGLVLLLPWFAWVVVVAYPTAVLFCRQDAVDAWLNVYFRHSLSLTKGWAVPYPREIVLGATPPADAMPPDPAALDPVTRHGHAGGRVMPIRRFDEPRRPRALLCRTFVLGHLDTGGFGLDRFSDAPPVDRYVNHCLLWARARDQVEKRSAPYWTPFASRFLYFCFSKKRATWAVAERGRAGVAQWANWRVFVANAPATSLISLRTSSRLHPLSRNERGLIILARTGLNIAGAFILLLSDGIAQLREGRRPPSGGELPPQPTDVADNVITPAPGKSGAPAPRTGTLPSGRSLWETGSEGSIYEHPVHPNKHHHSGLDRLLQPGEGPGKAQAIVAFGDYTAYVISAVIFVICFVSTKIAMAAFHVGTEKRCASCGGFCGSLGRVTRCCRSCCTDEGVDLERLGNAVQATYLHLLAGLSIAIACAFAAIGTRADTFDAGTYLWDLFVQILFGEVIAVFMATVNFVKSSFLERRGVAKMLRETRRRWPSRVPPRRRRPSLQSTTGGGKGSAAGAGGPGDASEVVREPNEHAFTLMFMRLFMTSGQWPEDLVGDVADCLLSPEELTEIVHPRTLDGRRGPGDFFGAAGSAWPETEPVLETDSEAEGEEPTAATSAAVTVGTKTMD